MAGIASLPTEVLGQIAARVSQTSDLANLRLANRLLNRIVRPVLFSTACLYPQWSTMYLAYAGPDEIELAKRSRTSPGTYYNSRKFIQVLEHPELREYVKKVYIYACDTNCDRHPAEERWNNADFHLDWLQSILRITEFPNVKTVALCFDRHCGEVFDPEGCLNDASVRELVLDAFLEALQADTGGKIKHLILRNLESESVEGRLESGSGVCRLDHPAWAAILGRLEKLFISVVHEQNVPEGGLDLELPGQYEFWRKFPSRFLLPAVDNLQSLALYSDTALGLMPRVRLKSVHFPRLKSLTLGHFSFVHDYEVEWILSHANTLRSLRLDHCFIVYMLASKRPNWLGSDGYPITNSRAFLRPSSYRRYPDHTPVENFDEETFTATLIETRWHNIFDRFGEKLTELQSFWFGSAQGWNFDAHHRGPNDGGPGKPIMPFEPPMDAPSSLFPARYKIWNDFDFEFAWKEEQISEEEYPEVIEHMLKERPDCDGRDEEAMMRLLGKMARTAV
ncbi:hypothetical protein B0I35DRAFT_439071 [Stachybotrys elegans]|uniref:F-box domain-containing protein n=1 Tax=Stachybotrys elegans TaxID=80388 RepID=A0A8K0SK05_9HYPO|nr:hypothetical protein B0I35DRAFT_439071 [Stachybotrys elegans]